MTAFHEGQEVEVQTQPLGGLRDDTWRGQWRKAKIVGDRHFRWPGLNPCYEVQFADGTRAVCDAEHIREICPICAAGGGIVA